MDNNDLQMIIKSLHQAQEISEQLINLQKLSDKKIKLIEKRLERFLEKNANYLDFNIVAITENTLKRNIQSTIVTLKEVEINSQFFENLHIAIFSDKAQEITGIFLRVNDDSSPFGFPASNVDSLGFQLSVPDGKLENDLIERLSSLGTTDWNTAKSIFVLLEKLFTEYTDSLGTLGKHSSKVLAYIRTQAAKFSNWPATLRFDCISTGKIRHTENHHSLQIRIENLSIAQKYYSEFEFRLSTITNENSDFGSHPRLEFSETCKDMIENWYAESTDENGQKLELRLAAPNALDTEVWNLLSDNDRLLITGLIGKLPKLVESLAKAEPSISMRWADWCSLAIDTRTIFVKNMIIQRNGLISKKPPQSY